MPARQSFSPRPVLIGIDTGGTYTDAVVFSETDGVIAKAKALTTPADLSAGIGEALDAAMAGARTPPEAVGMVALSTTLATNAVVEGLGDPIGLVLIGLDDGDFSRGGLTDALGGDARINLRGGHDAHGGEAAALDMSPLDAWALAATSARAFAVAGRFAVANPAHEIAVRDRLAAIAGKPVTCGHELSARLNAPKRALTTLLNARLIGIIHHLLDATAVLLLERRITAPLMVVKGDGSLIAAAEARKRPIETILSGPAASLVGARHLTGLDDALVADIGGTTTDVALLAGGRPRLDPQGAKVGGWSTLVEAVAMRTVGLGGDSDVRQPPDEARMALVLGPRRIVPVSLLAQRFPAEVHAALDRQLAVSRASEDSGRFALGTGRPVAAPTDAAEAELLEAVGAGPAALDTLLSGRRQRAALKRLLYRGAVQVAGFTPSDAAHVLGLHAAWDGAAADKAATLFARRQTSRGEAVAADAAEISQAVVEALRQKSAETLLDAALAESDDAALGDLASASTHPLVQAALRRRAGLVRLGVALAVPIVALGASARTYYDDVAERLGTRAVSPDHADVANAIGAVVGHVRVAAEALISQPADGVFRAHAGAGPTDFDKLEAAIEHVEAFLRAEVAEKARLAGAVAVDIGLVQSENLVMFADRPLFIEMRIVATAVGRPAAVLPPPLRGRAREG